MNPYPHSPFAGLYEPLTEDMAKKYLARMGFEGKVTPSLSSLTELQTCQLRSVPFENLEPFHQRREPSLATADLYRKIVLEKRGGYCFELNGLFLKLLCALGFSAHAVLCRLLFGRDYPNPPAHQASIIPLDGTSYFCDVGFGGPVPAAPMPLLPDREFTDPAGRLYVFTEKAGLYTLFIRKGEAWDPLMSFFNTPCDPSEFIPFNTFCAMGALGTPFPKTQMLWRGLPQGRISLDGDLLRETVDGKTVETRITTDAALREALKKHFGIRFDLPFHPWH
ncbi:MAG: arylamine N-acetyltransferase [Clostridia bacterium]|nr:arylamine N-acetyltransferase [Clostridia bacterium]